MSLHAHILSDLQFVDQRDAKMAKPNAHVCEHKSFFRQQIKFALSIADVL